MRQLNLNEIFAVFDLIYGTPPGVLFLFFIIFALTHYVPYGVSNPGSR